MGVLINGPYGLITGPVAADLGNHKSLKGNAKAVGTITSIINGFGSSGAILGPLTVGYLAQISWKWVYFALILSDILAIVCLLKLLFKEWIGRCRRSRTEE